MADVIVIGAGLAGLTVGHRLQQLGVDVRVIEKGAIAGGNVRTMQREGWRHEWGPSSFLGSATALHALAAELALVPVQAHASANKRYLFLDGRLQPMPSSLTEAITSPLLPAAAKLRLVVAPFSSTPPREEETVREFFETRLGREFTDRFVDAFVSGIHGGDIARLGIAASFPRLFELVKQHGSLAKAVIPALKSRKPGGLRGTFSFAGGLGDLAHALAAKLGERLETGANLLVRREGGRWHVGSHAAPELIVAAPAHAASMLLARDAAALSEELDLLAYAPMVGVHLLYSKDAIEKTMDGFGFLIPRRERVRLLGCLWSSTVFDVCAPDRASLACFLGGALDHEAVTLSDEALTGVVRDNLRQTMGIEAAPLDLAIIRIPRAIPQYGPQHVAWRGRVARLVGEQPGLALTGNAFEGVSLNDTVRHAENVARQVHRRLVDARRAA